MSVRVRVAPSPTGEPHLGTAYIALFNLAFARARGGRCVLRIEDTDRARSSLAAERAILQGLRWLGLEWDEGPDVGGDFGPYRQSERGDIYRRYAEELVERGHAFKCYRTADELTQLRAGLRGGQRALQEADLALPAAEVAAREAAGGAFVVRMRVPEAGVCVVRDRLRGAVEFDWAGVDAQVLLKADGLPTYHLANVVDDHLMGISHVIRGEEWLNSAPKHQLLYRYFDWEMPELCHMPLLRNPDKSKLSKRKNPTSINYYRAMGYLPEALLNYLARMGWAMADGAEKFSFARMVECFDLDRVALGAPVFDAEKLDWLNGLWIREDLDEAAFAERVAEWALNPGHLRRMVPLLKERVEKFTDIAALAEPFFIGLPVIEAATLDGLRLERAAQVRVLQCAAWWLDAQGDWRRDALYAGLKNLAAGLEVRFKDFLQPLFVAMSGRAVCLPLFDLMEILGADLTRARVRHALAAAGGVSKKLGKVLEGEYRGLAE